MGRAAAFCAGPEPRAHRATPAHGGPELRDPGSPQRAVCAVLLRARELASPGVPDADPSSRCLPSQGADSLGAQEHCPRVQLRQGGARLAHWAGHCDHGPCFLVHCLFPLAVPGSACVICPQGGPFLRVLASLAPQPISITWRPKREALLYRKEPWKQAPASTCCCQAVTVGGTSLPPRAVRAPGSALVSGGHMMSFLVPPVLEALTSVCVLGAGPLKAEGEGTLGAWRGGRLSVAPEPRRVMRSWLREGLHLLETAGPPLSPLRAARWAWRRSWRCWRPHRTRRPAWSASRGTSPCGCPSWSVCRW